MEGDVLVFKFRKINKHFIESLVSPSLYFAKPDSLNDPFDCRLDLFSSFNEATLESTGKRREYLFKFLENPDIFRNWDAQMSKIGVCSFSSTADETLLWSHYADDHKGACVLYRLPESFIKSPTLHLTAGGEVGYAPDPLTNWLKTADIEGLDIDSFVGQLIHIYLKSKSPAWQPEKEVRLIRRNNGVVAIENNFIQQICFGLQTPVSDIDLVSKLAKAYCKCEKFGQMIRNKSDFGFTMKQLC